MGKGVHRRPALTVDAIVERKGSILLVKRGSEPFYMRWALPGGFVEKGESAEEAVEREVKEETGLEVRSMELQNVYTQPDRDPRGDIISLCYAVECDGELTPGDDAAEARFFPISDVLSLNLAFDHDRMIRDYLEKRHVLQ